MWNDISSNKKNKYKELILAFASLSEIFSQKSDGRPISPIVNSKFQETVFNKSFGSIEEDIGNTAFDVSLSEINGDVCKRYLIGIKTFGINAGYQKVAQFKANIGDWSSIINKLHTKGTEEEINEKNKDLYLEIARIVSNIRNKRIQSAKAKTRGFKDLEVNCADVESVYHVLMPHKEEAKISVGETSYDEIDIENITIRGCTNKNNPCNFDFTDGKHSYRFTAADSQLLMNFENSTIVKETWNVNYVKDVYQVFERLFSEVRMEKIESYCWYLTNKDGEMETCSGFNGFYAPGSKIAKNKRIEKVKKIINKYRNVIGEEELNELETRLLLFLNDNRKFSTQKKIKLRKEILELSFLNADLRSDISGVLFRPMSEMYIPIPKSREFHESHPYFFGKNACELDGNKLKRKKEDRTFNLIFEPSKNKLKCFITQDNGKAIESFKKQSYLGEWIFKEVFQLNDYEPLTKDALNRIGINGIRLYKDKSSDDIHLSFIWIDKENPPEDLIEK